MRIILLLLLTTFITELSAQNIKQTLRGKVTNESGIGLAKVNISIESAQIKVQTSDEGKFEINDLPIGRYSVQFSGDGFETQLLTEVLVEAGKQKVVEISLKSNSLQLGDVVVRASKPTAFNSINTITQEQTLRYAGTFFDPARLATSFPGVVAGNDQANGLVIRGNSPNGMQWRLEGVEIVNPNHLTNAGTFSDRPTQTGGGTTIFSAQLLEKADFLTGAFPAEYGNVLSGVMDVHLRKGNNERHEFTGQAGLMGIDLAAEGPISKKAGSSYLVNYRYSFTGLLGLMGVRFGGEDIRYTDLAFNLSFPTKKSGNFTVFGMFGKSSNDFQTDRDFSNWKVDKDERNILFKSSSQTYGITHTLNLSPSTVLRTVIAGSQNNNSRFENVIYVNPSERNEELGKERYTFSSIITKKFKLSSLKIGAYLTNQIDNIYTYFTPTFSRFGRSNLISKGIAQPFVNYNVKLNSKLSLQTGLHYLYYDFNKSSSLEPRAALDFSLSDKSHINVAYGLHSQLNLPQIYLIDFGANTVNPQNIGFVKSNQLVVGYENSLNRNSKIKIEAYYSGLNNVPVASDFKNLYSLLKEIEYLKYNYLQNAGTGRNYGLEATYEKYLTKNYYMVVAGSIYKSLATGSDGIERSTRFDGGHTFSFTGGKEFHRKPNRTVGINTRILWSGGFRDTPIDEDDSQRLKTTIYDTSQLNSIKLADYFRTDLRVYWKKNKPNFTRTWSLDIQNLTNTENESYSYFDVRTNAVIKKHQLGLIPVLSYKIEFRLK